MITRHELGYLTKRTAQFQFFNESGQESLVYVDLVKDDNGVLTNFKPKTKNTAELDYINNHKEELMTDLTK